MTTPNRRLRRTIIELIHHGSSPHVASALSVVEILNAVYTIMDVEKIRRRDQDRDRLVLSKGHSTCALYAVMAEHGLMPKDTLTTFHANGSLLAGHASHFVEHIEHSTGALGHGLSAALGMALGLRSLGSNSRVFVVTGDGELHEGSNWEALMLAGHLGLNNLGVLIDNNGIDQMAKLEHCCSIEPLRPKLESFGFFVEEVDGHDETAMTKILARDRRASTKPFALICATVKGKGVSFMEGNTVWHYRTPQGDDYEKALMEL